MKTGNLCCAFFFFLTFPLKVKVFYKVVKHFVQYLHRASARVIFTELLSLLCNNDVFTATPIIHLFPTLVF